MAETLLHEPEVTLELARQHGLTDEEYGWIVEKLGRTPTFTELGIYSVMWSEHCSYKNSIAVLKTLPREGPALLVGAGEENAGLVDIGDGLAVAFKIESHNHPSAVEPYQGAATGVGGIHRDIFTMGARPICALNSLRFGRLDNPRVRYLLDGVVRGIADYGNAFGVPTVAGEVYFDPSYEGNPLVNAMSVGIVRVGQTVSAARGVKATWFTLWARPPDATASTGPRSLPKKSRKKARPNGRASRWAIPLPKSCSWRPRWRPSAKGLSSACRTWARPGSPALRAR